MTFTVLLAFIRSIYLRLINFKPELEIRGNCFFVKPIQRAQSQSLLHLLSQNMLINRIFIHAHPAYFNRKATLGAAWVNDLDSRKNLHVKVSFYF